MEPEKCCKSRHSQGLLGAREVLAMEWMDPQLYVDFYKATRTCEPLHGSDIFMERLTTKM